MQFKKKIKTLALNYSTQIKGIDTHILRILVSMLYTLSGADPGFVVRGGVSRRWFWGPLKVPSGSRAEPW